LGKGSFSRVYEIRDTESGQIFAVKIIEKKNLKQKEYETISHEINLHKSLNHVNILKLVRHFEDDNCIYIVLERCSQMSLYDMLYKRKRYSMEETRAYVLQLVKALQ